MVVETHVIVMVVETHDEAQGSSVTPSQEDQKGLSMKVKAINLIDMINLKDMIQIDHHHLRKNINQFDS